jgi:hypothetical protein
MPTWAWIVIAVAVVVALLAVVWIGGAERRRRGLRERFGPEYDRAVSRTGRREAEAELAEREEKRERLEIVPLAPEARERYLASWQTLQGRFVDQPSQAVGDADRLVSDVMRDRGYPMDDFEQRAADISVDHPDVVENYRAAHRIYAADRDGEASTEDLRQAVVHYRALFAELLETDQASEEEQSEEVSQ